MPNPPPLRFSGDDKSRVEFLTSVSRVKAFVTPQVDKQLASRLLSRLGELNEFGSDQNKNIYQSYYQRWHEQIEIALNSKNGNIEQCLDNIKNEAQRVRKS